MLSLRFVVILVIMTMDRFGLSCKDEPVSDDIAGSTVLVEVLPKSINELITNEINITCTPQDLPLGTKDILFIEMGKEGEPPLAALKGPKLELGTDAKNNMQAQGHISKNLSESYLQLSIKRPFVDDVGVYCCRMFYQNELSELKMGHVYADVTIENNDKAVFVHLLQKMSHMESYTSGLEKKLLEQQDYSNQLEKTLREQLASQKTQLSSRINELDVAGMNRSHMLQGIVERESFSSAFSAYGTKERFNAGETLIFKHSLLNIGGHYDMASGVFTAPRKGLYVFHLVVWTTTNDDVWIFLKVNGAITISLYGYDNSHFDQSSVSTVLSLNEGDKVSPFVHGAAKLAYVADKYTVFNGYLLKML